MLGCQKSSRVVFCFGREAFLERGIFAYISHSLIYHEQRVQFSIPQQGVSVGRKEEYQSSRTGNNRCWTLTTVAVVGISSAWPQT